MNSSKRKRIVFGIDEGLPSRVAASILRNQDFDLLAVHLQCDLAKLGEDPATYPSAMRASDLPSIEKYCESLGIPLKTVDVTEETLAKVYTPFWIATLSGRRYPGSAVWAREILFAHLDSVASARGAQLLATGHFAKCAPELCRYPEEGFDQSRSFARLDRKVLEKLCLPVGDVSVEMLMRLAREIGATPKDEEAFSATRETAVLAASRANRGVWEWTDAQLADPRVHARAAGDFFKPGPVSGADEFAVGDHRGIPFYQVGSRAPRYDGYSVCEILPQSRTLVVGPDASVYTDHLYVQDILWNDVKAEGRHRERRFVVEKEIPNRRVANVGPTRVAGRILEFPGGLGELRLETPMFGIGRGDVLVFFEESRVLGSAVVAETLKVSPAEMAIEKAAPPA